MVVLASVVVRNLLREEGIYYMGLKDTGHNDYHGIDHLWNKGPFKKWWLHKNQKWGNMNTWKDLDVVEEVGKAFC